MSTAFWQSHGHRRIAVVAGILILGAAVAFTLFRTARDLATSASVINRTDESLRVIPIGMSPDGPVPLPLKPPHSRDILTVPPDETLVFRYVPGVATFCWMLIIPPQGPMRIKDSHTDRGSCKTSVAPSTPWWPPASEYFISPKLEELPPAPPELVRVGERRLAEP